MREHDVVRLMRNIALSVALIRNRLRHVEAARKIGRSPGWFSGVVNGWVNPSKGDRRKLAQLLGLAEDEIFPEPGRGSR